MLSRTCLHGHCRKTPGSAPAFVPKQLLQDNYLTVADKWEFSARKDFFLTGRASVWDIIHPMTRILICLFFSICLLCPTAYGWYPHQPEESLLPQTGGPTLIGTHFIYHVHHGDTLIEVARKFGLGYLALARANPGIDPWLPAEGEKVLLPYAFLPPPALQPGITINLAELRLYYVWREADRLRVRVYPVGIGRSGWDTPTGEFAVTRKIVHPVWHPPASIRLENPQLPASVPAGPGNPLGEYWLGLSQPGYGIHGTNKPYGVGRRVSHGCLRLYPEDIRDLFARARIGTPVRIIRQAVKAGRKNGRLLLEVHRPGETPDPALMDQALRNIEQLPWRGPVDIQAVKREISLGRGVPTVVSPE